MRFVRLRLGNDLVFARLGGDGAHVLRSAPWVSRMESGVVHPIDGAMLACPVSPAKIVCIGRNYVAHAAEMGSPPPREPLLFLKPPTSLLEPGGVVLLPAVSERVEHEAELGVVIGRGGRNIPRSEALAHVFGYTCVADITARDLQRKDGQWTRAKGFDTFCPVGPVLETDLDPAATRIVCRVNGQVRQQAPTSHMIFDVPALVAYISAVMTLEPGDLIVTGTPEGVGPLAPGDALEVEIDGIGVLAVHVGR